MAIPMIPASLQRRAEAIGYRVVYTSHSSSYGGVHPCKWPYSLYIEPCVFINCYATLEQLEAAFAKREAWHYAHTRGVGTTRYRLDDSVYVDRPPVLTKYIVVRKTPKGAWIMREDSYAHLVKPLEERSVAELRDERGARFVLDGQGRRYAHETEQWARDSYRCRKLSQRRHARASLERAEAMLQWLDTGELPQPEMFQFSFTTQTPEY